LIFDSEVSCRATLVSQQYFLVLRLDHSYTTLAQLFHKESLQVIHKAMDRPTLGQRAPFRSENNGGGIVAAQSANREKQLAPKSEISSRSSSTMRVVTNCLIESLSI
jgi:hypothetical protein